MYVESWLMLQELTSVDMSMTKPVQMAKYDDSVSVVLCVFTHNVPMLIYRIVIVKPAFALDGTLKQVHWDSQSLTCDHTTCDTARLTTPVHVRPDWRFCQSILLWTSHSTAHHAMAWGANILLGCQDQRSSLKTHQAQVPANRSFHSREPRRISELLPLKQTCHINIAMLWKFGQKWQIQLI